MRDKNRLDEFYNQLHDIHKKSFPDYRFGQFVNNIFNWIACTYNRDVFFIEEGEMLKLIKEYANTHSCWYRDN